MSSGRCPRAKRARGQFKYDELVELCRSYDVLTPEDPYPVVAIGGREVRIAPLFLLYDYSFRPLDIPMEQAVEWAGEAGVCCADEMLLHPEPYAAIAEWCHARCEMTERRLTAHRNDLPTVLINPYPLRADLARLPRIPPFPRWFGTRRTEHWPLRLNATDVVSALYIRSTSRRDGVRSEVSLWLSAPMDRINNTESLYPRNPADRSRPKVWSDEPPGEERQYLLRQCGRSP